MSSQSAGLRENLIAFITREGLLAGVSPLVTFEMVGRGEALVALITSIWPVARLDPHMNSEVTR